MMVEMMTVCVCVCVCDRKIMMIKNSGMVRFEQQVFRVTEVVKSTGELKLSKSAAYNYL